MDLRERKRELCQLDQVVTAAKSGDGTSVLVEGPAGIGKTALLAAARERARRAGLRVLAAHGGELESAFPYGVVRQLFERAWMNGVGARGSPRSAPAMLAERALGDTPRAPAVDEDASFGILHGLYWFAVDLAAESPTMLVIDDAHWADVDSLRFVDYLLRRLEGVPLAAIVGARDVERGPQGALLERLRCQSPVRVIELAPLSVDAAAAVIGHEYGSTVGREFAAACHRATGGNPHYLRELVRAMSLEGVVPDDDQAERVEHVTPGALRRYVLARVAAVGPDAPRVAGALSVVGDGGALRHAAQIAGIDETRTAELAKALVHADVLSSEDPVEFVHPIVRRAIASNLTASDREDGHLLAARLLLTEAMPPPGQVAAHLLLTRPGARGWCVRALREAARDAMAQSAAEAAVVYLRRAVAEPPEELMAGAVLRELAAAEALKCDPRAVDHFRLAIRVSGDQRERGEVTLDLAAVLTALFRTPEAYDALEAARADLDSADGDLRARLDAALISAALQDGASVERGVALLGERAGRFPPGDAGRSMRAQLALVMALTGCPADEVGMTAEAALAEAGDEDLWTTWEIALAVLVIAERFDSAARCLARADALDCVRLSPRRASSLEAGRGFLATRLGALADAEAHLRTSLELAPPAGAAPDWLLVRGWLTDALTLRGDLDDAAEVLASAPPRPWPAHPGAGYAMAAHARLRFAQNQIDDGLAELAALADRERTWSLVGPAVHHWRADAATALFGVGRVAEARDLITEDLARARAYGAPRTLGIDLRVAGLVEGGARGLELLQEAVAVLETTPAMLERARALVELGAALRRANRRQAARAVLDEGLRLAQRCAARPLAQRAYDELLASGKRLRPIDRDDRNALTPSERRIARLAAEGMTNREIAQTLYLATKTVEMHLGRVYRKLDLRSRTQLSHALGDS